MAKEERSLMQIQKNYITSIGQGLEEIIGSIGSYQAVCGYNILSQINLLLAKEGLNFKDPKVDRESVHNAIKYAIIYSLNTDNREVFVILRNDKRPYKAINPKTQKEEEKVNWVKVVEVKPQYKGVLKILSTFGRDVKKVYSEWIVREGDDFKYQTFKGLEVIPPEWTPKGTQGKILRVVVPVQYKDGTVDFRIAERESVATNIKAQIKQSLMSATDTVKTEILAKIQDMTLDQLLEDKGLSKYVNDTYTGISREEMLITKLVLNAVKRVQIDYQSALARELNEKTFDNADVYKQNHTAEEVLAMNNAPMLENVEEIETEESEKREFDQDGVEVRKEPDDDVVSLFETNYDE